MLAPALAAAAVLFNGDPAAAASCPTGNPPCITKLTAQPTTGGKFLLVVNFSAACNYDVFHLTVHGRQWSPTEWKRSRSRLCNDQVQTFVITNAFKGATVTAQIQGCVKYVLGKDRCTAFSAPETIVLGEGAPSPTGGWGAVAADGKGHWGYAVGMRNEQEARNKAVQGCGNGNCKVAISGRQSCVAYADSRDGGYWYGVSLVGTKAEAERVAIAFCQKGAKPGTCKVANAVCS